MRTGEPAQQYAALRQVATAVARGADADSVFALVAERAAALVGADGCGVVRFDGGRGRLVGRWALPGLFDGEVPRDIGLHGESTVAKVARTGHAARVDHYSQLKDARGRFLATVYESGVAVPVRLGVGVWGAVAVASTRPGAFADDAEEQLADFAELVALAVASPEPNSRVGIEALLETLLASAPVGIAFLDRDLRFVRVNRALAEISGTRIEAHVGATIGELAQAYPSALIDALDQVRDGGDPVLELEVRGEREGGEIRHWLGSSYPVRPQQGPSLGVGMIIVDVTEQKRVEEDLRRERDYSAALIEAMQDGLAVAAPDGRLIDVNHRFCEMTGFAAGELVGSTPPYAYWPAEDLTSSERAFRLALQGHAGEHDLVYRRRDGQPLPVVVAHAPLRDANGELRGFVATVRDVTDRRRAEEERALLLAAERLARHRTEVLQEFTAALASALTPDQVVEIAVGRAFPAVGATRGVVMLVEDEGLVPPRSHDLQTDAIGSPLRLTLDDGSPLSEVARTGKAMFFESRAALGRFNPATLERVRSDTHALAVVPLAIEGEPLGVLAVAFDDPRTFTPEDRSLLAAIGDLCAQALERARLYEAAHENAEALRQRDALRTAVLRGVSHEFRSPLTAIANAASALERIDDATERLELASVVGTETRRLDRFVANVLDLSRLEGGVLEPRLDSCSVYELVAGALEAFAALAGAMPVDVDVQDAVPLVRADPVLTERILLNLLHNAARHGGPEIRLEVRTGPDSIDFVVADDGPGIAPGASESIFEPFVGERERGGLGLGLGLSRGLAEAQGGRLRLDPAARGARFVLSLPVDDWAAR